MHHTEIKIFKIAQTKVDWDQIIDWLEFLGVPGEQSEKVLDSVGYLNMGGDAASLIALCGKRCYNSFTTELNPNVTKIREELAPYITNILKSGHGSVLEHATWTFAIENISRVFTGEMNRHRAGVAISEASMRYIRFDDIGFTMPISVAQEIDNESRITEQLINNAFEDMQQTYIDLCNVWKIDEMKDFKHKKELTSMFRRIIGMGVSTGGVWTINCRALRHIITMRGSIHAEEEIYHVFNQIAEIMIEDEPLLFGDFEKDEQGSWVPKYEKV